MATININPGLRRRLKRLALDRGVTLQFLSETALDDFACKLEKKNGGKKTQ